MADLIDEFVIALNLDPKQYNEEIKKFRKGVKDDRDETVKSAKTTEAANKSAVQGLRSLKNEALALFTVFTGARSLKDFAAGILESDANTGRLAANLGVATKALSSWQMAVRTVGGQSGDADSSFQSLNDTLQNLVLRGDGSKTGLLGALGMTYGDLNDIPSAMLKISAASEHMSRQKFVSIATALGISPAMINLLEKGRKGVEDVVRAQEANGAITEKDAIEAQKFQAAWANLTNFITGQARPVITELTKDLLDAANGTGEWGERAKVATGLWNAMADAIGNAVSKLQQWMGLDKKGQEDPDAIMEKRYLDAGQYKNALLWGFHAFRRRHGMASDQSQLPPPPPGGWVVSTPSSAGPSVSDDVSSQFSVLEKAYGTARARGIWAGIGAESSWNPDAFNKTGGGEGAYGLGQWRSGRLKELRRRYGNKPTAAQQIEYLMWEINGGDKGGASVRNSTSALDALSNYIGGHGWGFMRPGVDGRVGDMSRGTGILGVKARGGTTHNSGPITVTVYTSSDKPREVGQEVGKAMKARGIVVNSNSGLQ